ncbi:MAG TPA: alpha/beta fold hydrolase [Acidimicrobiales bacterium]|nr:alpha/beta fold hydrolase [Acidimicrobiales bacterium]
MGAVGKALCRPGTYLGHAREAIDIARAVAHYPAGLLDAAIRCGDATGDVCHDTPVVLVHGYGHNRSGWFVVERALRTAGFSRITSLNYNPLRHGVPEIAEQLKAHVDLVRSVTGAERVHVIGHSLGGLVLRWYVQELGGDATVATAVTVASPHHGTVAAMLVRPLGETAKQLLPGSPVIERLQRGARSTSVRWVSYYSNIDLLVQPSRSAVLEDAENVLIKDHGHLSILLSGRMAASVVEQLEAWSPAPAAAAPSHVGGPARAAR